jgi:hypothetical protein
MSGVFFLDQPSDFTYRFMVESASLPGIGYVVVTVAGKAACPCLGFSYRGACRHSRAVLAHLAELVPA